MGHNISWDNEDKTVVLQEYVAVASKDDLYHLATKSAAMLKTVAHPVHLIIDERKVSLVLDANDIAYLEKLTPPNQGAVVMVVLPSKLPYKLAVQSLGKILGPKAFAKPFFVETLDEARTFLQANFAVRYPSAS